MFIVRRAAQVAGLEGLEWARSVTQVVQDAGVPVSLWMGGLGAVPGSVAWSVPVASIAEWVGYSDRLLADAAYRGVVAGGREAVIEFQPDQMMELIHGEISAPTEVGGFIGAVEATVHPDRSVDAAMFAIEVADAWTAASGAPVVVANLAAGDMSTILWLASHADAASLDDAHAKVAGSAAYGEVLAKGNGLFTAGVRRYARRIA
jgi:hypothetical protein